MSRKISYVCKAYFNDISYRKFIIYEFDSVVDMLKWVTRLGAIRVELIVPQND